MGRPIGARKSAVEKARMRGKSSGEGSTSAVPEVKNGSVFMDIVLNIKNVIDSECSSEKLRNIYTDMNDEYYVLLTLFYIGSSACASALDI